MSPNQKRTITLMMRNTIILRFVLKHRFPVGQPEINFLPWSRILHFLHQEPTAVSQERLS
ncbi:hypothetical protein OESDEN_07975, partial [Oesophagostomum dentatum]